MKPEDEELETGEPIEGEEAVTGPKIAALRVRFSSLLAGGSSAGSVPLACAKYLDAKKGKGETDARPRDR